jgi:hypothetical protein
MKYVYLIQSISYPKEKYIGITSDLKARLKVHNKGARHIPQNSNLGNSLCIWPSLLKKKPGSLNNILKPVQGGPSPNATSGLKGNKLSARLCKTPQPPPKPSIKVGNSSGTLSNALIKYDRIAHEHVCES